MPPPLVSINIVTYNQESYIAQAIESVLIQETDFPFELIIGEDCSTDGTRDIVFDYQKKHPDIIRVITSEKNVGIVDNWQRVMKNCRGEFIALCEGDDYWTDPKKLQKQVDLLRAHPEASMCAAKTQTCGTINGKEAKHFVIGDDISSNLLYFQDITFLHTSTYLICSSYWKRAKPWFKTMAPYDIVILHVLSDMGPIAFLPEVVSVYHMTSEGVATSRSPRALSLLLVKVYGILYSNYKEEYRDIYAERIVRAYIGRLLSDIKRLDFSESYGSLQKMSKLIWKHHLAGKSLIYAIKYAIQSLRRGIGVL